jgi:hypothetical protein
MRIAAAVFDLAGLRGAFSEQFADWDAAVKESDTLKAKRARRTIQRIAREGLSKSPATLGGFYLFHDPSVPERLGGLNYIGIADSPRRPIARRIEDRLKDDSSLDVALDEMAECTVRTIVTARLLCALPNSGQNYVDKHLRVAALFRRSPIVILLGCEQPRELIRETEKILIASAAAVGAPLTNDTHIRFRGRASKAAIELADAVIVAAAANGLPTNGINDWRESLSKIVTPTA